MRGRGLLVVDFLGGGGDGGGGPSHITVDGGDGNDGCPFPSFERSRVGGPSGSRINLES